MYLASSSLLFRPLPGLPVGLLTIREIDRNGITLLLIVGKVLRLDALRGSHHGHF